ncbi:MAG: LolA family protein [Myxococcales bacterium]
MIPSYLLSLLLSGTPGPLPAAPITVAQAPAQKKDAQPKKPAPAAKPEPAAPTKAEPAKQEPAKAEPADATPMEPEVKRAVDQMQKFYEETKDFESTFEQTYTYKTFNRKQKSSGTVRFMKQGAAMRWDYEKPSPKVFVVAFNKVFMHDPEAKQVTIAPINTEKLSASVTFLWGQGRLEREFDIKRAERKDLTGGIALELTPKVPDPRFQRVFFLIDAQTFAVKETIVVDPDGSENRMAFGSVKINTGFKPDVFKLSPPPDTQVIDMTRPQNQP